MKRIILTAALIGVFAVAQNNKAGGTPKTGDTTGAGQSIGGGAQNAIIDLPKAKHSLHYSLDLDYKENGKQVEGEHLVRYIYQINDDYKLVPRLSFFTNYNRGDDNKWKSEFAHQFVQIQLEGPKFTEFAGHTVKWVLRYSLPTDNGSQQAGSYGSVSPRLVFEKKYNAHFNMTYVTKLGLNLQRNGYPIRGGTKNRNKLVQASIEVTPQYVIQDNLTLTGDFEVIGVYLGDSKLGKTYGGSAFSYEYYTELELMYTIESMGKLGVGAIAISEGNFGNGLKKEGAFNKGNNFYGLRVQKGFDL